MLYNKLIFKEKYIIPVKRQLRYWKYDIIEYWSKIKYGIKSFISRKKYKAGKRLAKWGKKLGYADYKYITVPAPPPVNIMDKFDKHTIQVVRTKQENYFLEQSLAGEELRKGCQEYFNYIQNVEKREVANQAVGFLEKNVKVTKNAFGQIIYRLEFFTKKGE